MGGWLDVNRARWILLVVLFVPLAINDSKREDTQSIDLCYRSTAENSDARLSNISWDQKAGKYLHSGPSVDRDACLPSKEAFDLHLI